MIISSILSLIAIGVSGYLGNNEVLHTDYTPVQYGVTRNACDLYNYYTQDENTYSYGNGYEDVSYGNFVNFFFEDYEIMSLNGQEYDRLRISLTFRDDDNNTYTGSIDYTFNFLSNSSDCWFGVGVNSFTAENQPGINASITPMFLAYELNGAYNEVYSNYLKETALYNQVQYLANYGIIYSSSFTQLGIKAGIHIELKPESVLMTQGDSEYYFWQGYDQGSDTAYNYYENEVIPNLTEQYEAEKSASWQNGFLAGKQEYEDSDSQINSIFSGILSIGLVPINVFLAMLNWEVFGINVGAFVSATISVLVIVLLFRFIFKGKASDD